MLFDGQKQLDIDTFLANVADLRSTATPLPEVEAAIISPFLSGFTHVPWCKVPCLEDYVRYMLDITFLSKTSLVQSPPPTPHMPTQIAAKPNPNTSNP